MTAWMPGQKHVNGSLASDDEHDTSKSSDSSSDTKKSSIDSGIEVNRQRTVLLSRRTLDETFGFALQSYVIERKGGGRRELVTYVDYVHNGSPADLAGVQRGDRVVAVNGREVLGESHASLVALISTQLSMRLVVVLQNIARIVQLQARKMQLQYVLAAKLKEINKLEEIEAKLCDGVASSPESSALDCSLGAQSSVTSDLVECHPEDPYQQWETSGAFEEEEDGVAETQNSNGDVVGTPGTSLALRYSTESQPDQVTRL